MRRATFAVLLLAGQAFGQGYYTRHNFTVGMGAGQPRGDLRGLYSDSFGVNVGYGYRFHPFFQVDAGFETLFGAAGVRDFLPTALGDLRIKDYQHFIPMGGRVIVPLIGDRLLISGGGGGAYMRYTERVRQPLADAGYRFDCSVCSTRDGWGYYGLAGVSVAVDRGRHFRIGVNGKVYRGHTDGDPLGAAPPVRTRDHWVNIVGEFGFSF